MPTPEDQSELRDSIRVRRDDRATTLKPLSRLFYGKVYEVMHDVKVHSFGYVSNSSQQVLKREFEASLGCQALNFTGMTNVVEELDDEMDYSEAMLFQMGGTDSSESEGRSVDSSDEEWPDGYVGGDLLSETNVRCSILDLIRLLTCRTDAASCVSERRSGRTTSERQKHDGVETKTHACSESQVRPGCWTMGVQAQILPRRKACG